MLKRGCLQSATPRFCAMEIISKAPLAPLYPIILFKSIMAHAAPNVSEQTVQFYTYLLLYLMFNPVFKSIMERTAPKRCAACSLKQWRVARQAHSAVTGKVAGAFGRGRSGGSCHWQAHIAVAGPVAGALDGGRSSGSCPCHAEILLPLQIS